MDRRQMDSEGCIDHGSGLAPSCNAEAVAGGQSSHGDRSRCVCLDCCSMRIEGILECDPEVRGAAPLVCCCGLKNQW